MSPKLRVTLRVSKTFEGAEELFVYEADILSPILAEHQPRAEAKKNKFRYSEIVEVKAVRANICAGQTPLKLLPILSQASQIEMNQPAMVHLLGEHAGHALGSKGRLLLLAVMHHLGFATPSSLKRLAFDWTHPTHELSARLKEGPRQLPEA